MRSGADPGRETHDLERAPCTGSDALGIFAAIVLAER